jgi:Acetyltransferase (GNAT) family
MVLTRIPEGRTTGQAWRQPPMLQVRPPVVYVNLCQWLRRDGDNDQVLGSGDEPVLFRIAPEVFDDSIDEAKAREFLADPRHHLVVALDADVVVGFISAAEYIHPDKPAPELWINEVGVAASHRRRASARRCWRRCSIAGQRRLHRGLGADGPIERRRRPALLALGGSDSDSVMFTFSLDGTWHVCTCARTHVARGTCARVHVCTSHRRTSHVARDSEVTTTTAAGRRQP